jgi:ABC-type phosphate transport system substrate-binding protein
MQRRHLLSLASTLFASALLGTSQTACADTGVVVIANAALRGIDTVMLRRIYTGRMVELDGLPLRPVQLPRGQLLRQRFLTNVMEQSEDDYTAYWTVRRYIGKGAPPLELPDTAALIEHVRRTPGAIGYIDAAELRPGLNVLLRR